jgi:hypothetical protein
MKLYSVTSNTKYLLTNDESTDEGQPLEITEKEREMLVGKKEEIRKLTVEILDMTNDEKNAQEIKKRMTSVISHLNTIASFSNARNYNLEAFTACVNALFLTMTEEQMYKLWIVSPIYIEQICNYANSMRFDFTKKDVKIHLPKIDLTIFKTGK